MNKLLVMVGIALVAGRVAQADLVAPPHKQEKKATEVTRTGTLLWGSEKGEDGSKQKADLILKAADGSVTSLGEAGSIPKALGHERFIGKQVEVTFTPQRFAFSKNRAKNISAIKEVVAAKP